MKALSICQPYPELILQLIKRVENRTWRTTYRGELLLHAGLSKQYLALGDLPPGELLDIERRDRNYGIRLGDMSFGAFVGRAVLVDCLHIEAIERGDHDRQYPWIREHEHTEGPWCWVLDQVQRLAEPIPGKGQLGIFEVWVPELGGAAA